MKANLNPTEAQKSAGNYRKEHLRLHGLNIAIENPRGSVRKGKDATGKSWECKLPAHYGYIKQTDGADGDHVDCFIGRAPTVNRVFVIDQREPVVDQEEIGAFDEHKVMFGFKDLASAMNTYCDAFSDGKGKRRIQAVTEFTVPQFKHWLKEFDTKKPAWKAAKIWDEGFARGGAVNGFADGGAPENIFADLIPKPSEENPANNPNPVASNISPSERDLMIRTLIGEARGQPLTGQEAVVHVMLNRLKQGNYGKNMQQIIFAPWQFEPWMTRKNELLSYPQNSPHYRSAEEVVNRVLSGAPDPTNGATHFLNPEVVLQRSGRLPAWARGEGTRIGSHVFHNHGNRGPGVFRTTVASAFAPEEAREPQQPSGVVNRVATVDLRPEEIIANATRPAPTRFEAPAAHAAPATTAEAPVVAASLSDNPFSDLIPKPEPQKMGRLDALAQGVKQGASFNFNDELMGFAAASPLPDVKGLPPILSGPLSLARTLTGGANVAYDKLISPSDATRRYEEARDAERVLNKKSEADRPGWNLTGNAAGSVALPLGAALKVATLPARMLQGMKVGATTGAISGIGEGETPEERATKGLIMGGAGGVLGAGLPAVISGAQKIGSGVKKLAQPVMDRLPFRGVTDIDKAAATNIVNAVNKDRAANAHGLDFNDWQKAKDAGLPVTLAELGGNRAQSLARVSANTSPEARSIIEKSVHDRFGTQAERTADFVTDLVRTPANAHMTREALKEAAETSRKPLYKRAMDVGSKGIDAPELIQLQTSPSFQKATKEAFESFQDLIASNRNHGSDVWIPNSPTTPQMMKPVLENGKLKWVPDAAPKSPDGKFTLEYWDIVKKKLDDQITAAKNAGNRNAAADLVSMKNTLVGVLDRQTMRPDYLKMKPEDAKFWQDIFSQNPNSNSWLAIAKSAGVPMKSLYAEARGVAATLFKADNALEAGEIFAKNGRFQNNQVRSALNKMTPEEKTLFQEGFVSRLKEEILESRSRRAIDQVLSGKASGSISAKERLEIVLGPAKAREFEARIHVESIMDRLKNAVTGNSMTARNLAEMGLIGTSGIEFGRSGLNTDPSQMSYAAIVGALTMGSRRVNQQLAKRTAEMLMSRDPEVLTKALRLVSNNRNMMEGLRKYEHKLLRLVGPNAPQGSVPAVRGVSAEENE